LKFRGKGPYEFLKLYGESWPKFKQVTKKVPTPWTLQLLAFDEKSTFDFFDLFRIIWHTSIITTKIKSGFLMKSEKRLRPVFPRGQEHSMYDAVGLRLSLFEKNLL
jgi:hypothetical protein